MIGGSGLNVSFMVGLAFAVAASANFPALLLALSWRRFNTTGAVTGVLVGVFSSIAAGDRESRRVAGGRFARAARSASTTSPTRASSRSRWASSGCYLGTVLSKEESKAERGFDELYVRSETGLGAEVGTGLGLTGRTSS